MSKYSLYRNRMRNEECCRLKYEAGFITDGTSATTITHVRLNTQKQAGLIINNSEGPDSATVYTYKEDDKSNELLKSDYFIWKENKYFVYEDIDIVLQTLYKKQLAYQCNVECEVGNQSFGGYYSSSLKKTIDQGLEKEISLLDKEKPILIAPTQDLIQIGQTLIINGKPWHIIEIDFTTNKGISYCSLELGWISKSEDIAEIKPTDCFAANQEIEIITEEGYFKTDTAVDIVNIETNKIIIKIPYGIDSITYSVKTGGQIQQITKQVVVG